MPASNFDLLNETTPFHFEYLRCKQTNRPLGEREREMVGRKVRKTDNQKGAEGGGIKWRSGRCEADNEEGEMTGTL